MSKRTESVSSAGLIEEGLEDYYCEVEAQLDEEHDRELWAAFMEAEISEKETLAQAREKAREAFEALPEDVEFFGNCNGPGVVYWTPRGTLRASKDELIENGGSPFNMTRKSARYFATEPDEYELGYPWDLRRW